MSYRKVWFLAAIALIVSSALMYADLFLSAREVSPGDNATMSAGWTIADGTKVLYQDSGFWRTGSLKTQHSVVLTRDLPRTEGQSVCFVAIGYAVRASVNGTPVYTFGTSLDSKEVWGVKAHVFRVPDGGDGRTLRLDLSTGTPGNIAMSTYILLEDATGIAGSLLRMDLVKLCFALLYVFIGVFMLGLSLIWVSFRHFDLPLLLLASIALLIGVGVLFNLSIVAFFAGPAAVYWIVCVVNLALPIPTLLFVAADRRFDRVRLILAVAISQIAFLCMWLVSNLAGVDLLLDYWHLPLTLLTAIALVVTFVREFRSGSGRPEIAVSVMAILSTSGINAWSYFTSGSHDAMDFSLIIMALPVLVLMTSKVTMSSLQREHRVVSENMALRLEGDLLHKNYARTERSIEETKRIWHDIDKHFSAIGGLVAAGEYDELRRYLKHAGHDLERTRSAYLCENRLVNAILVDKISEAESKDIRVSFAGNLPERLRIHGSDLCSLLVNMLDNAIEACVRMPDGKEKKIDIGVGMKNDFVYFSVANSSPEAPVAAGEGFATSKQDKEKHGYGIAIMQEVVRRYNGAFDIIPSEDSFTVRAALRNPAE